MVAASTHILSPTMDVGTKRQELLALDEQKKALMDEAEAIISELTAEAPNGGPPIGIDSPLVDAEGYPRADIDVYRARTLRKRFKEIQNDHKTLEKKIDIGLQEVAALAKGCGEESGISNGISSTTTKEDDEEKKSRLAPKPKPKFDPKTGKWVVKSWDGSVAGVEDGEMRSFDDLYATSNAALATKLRTNNNNTDSSGSAASTASSNTNQQQQQQTSQRSVSFQEGQQFTTPFAIIDEVSPNSPSSEAGLKENDLIIRFGNVNSSNHRDFKAIAELVPSAANDNKSITVAVRRKSTELGGIAEVIKTEVVELKPRTWAGRGLLGCHIIPYSE